MRYATLLLLLDTTIVPIAIFIYSIGFLCLRFFKVMKDWRAFAEANDLMFEQTGSFRRPPVNGTFRDHPIRLHPFRLRRFGSTGFGSVNSLKIDPPEILSRAPPTPTEIALPSSLPDRRNWSATG